MNKYIDVILKRTENIYHSNILLTYLKSDGISQNLIWMHRVFPTKVGPQQLIDKNGNNR